MIPIAGVPIKVETLRLLRKAKLPINGSQRLDVYSAFEELKVAEFDVDVKEVRCESGSGFFTLYLKVGRVTFRFFENGTVMIFGIAPATKEVDILNFMWSSLLKNCVIETI